MDVFLTEMLLNLFPGDCYFCVYLSVVPAGQKAPVVLMLLYKAKRLSLH